MQRRRPKAGFRLGCFSRSTLPRSSRSSAARLFSRTRCRRSRVGFIRARSASDCCMAAAQISAWVANFRSHGPFHRIGIDQQVEPTVGMGDVTAEDTTTTSAVLVMLLHHAHIVRVTGDSFLPQGQAHGRGTGVARFQATLTPSPISEYPVIGAASQIGVTEEGCRGGILWQGGGVDTVRYRWFLAGRDCLGGGKQGEPPPMPTTAVWYKARDFLPPGLRYCVSTTCAGFRQW